MRIFAFVKCICLDHIKRSRIRKASRVGCFLILIEMKKILLSAIFALLVCCSVSAHPIKVTLSNGQVVILESDDYETMEDLMAAIKAMERKISSSTDSSNPPTTAPKNP